MRYITLLIKAKEYVAYKKLNFDKIKQLLYTCLFIFAKQFDAIIFMKTPIISTSDLAKYRNDKELVELTSLQIKKDFALFGLVINYSENMDYSWQEVFDELEIQIRRLLEINSAKIISLLYQIDIPENKIIQRAEEQKERQLSDVVSEMIMERELKKVITRLYFKNLNK